MLHQQPFGDPLDRALAAYYRSGEIAIPSNASEVEEHHGREYVVLRNVNGTLAVYLIRPNGSLQGLAVNRWPAGLVDAA
jgi:hypothetical protein